MYHKTTSSQTIENNNYAHIDTQETEKELLENILITRGCLFNYSKRLEKKSHIKSITSNLLSLLTIISGVYLLSFSNHLQQNSLQFIGVLSIGISLISIFLSLEQPSPELSKKSTDANRCAREISQILRALKNHRIDFTSASQKYEDILSSYADSHDRCDYLKTIYHFNFDVRYPPSDANWFNSIFIWTLSQYSPFITVVAGLCIVLAVCFGIPMLNEIII